MLGPAGNQSRAGEGGGQWDQNSKGQPKEGAPGGGRGGGFSESYKLETERKSGHLHFLSLLIGIISLAPELPRGELEMIPVMGISTYSSPPPGNLSQESEESS